MTSRADAENLQDRILDLTGDIQRMGAAALALAASIKGGKAVDVPGARRTADGEAVHASLTGLALLLRTAVDRCVGIAADLESRDAQSR